jgi:hypothetical protein
MESTAKFTWLVRNLALLSLIFFLNSLASSANTKVQNRGAAKKPRVAGTVNLQDYGAIGDGSTDVGPALQAALNDLATAGGGTLVVPAGRFYLATPVSKQFAAGVSVTIAGDSQGTPIDVAGNGLGLNLGAKFIVAVGLPNNALTLQGLDSFLLRDIAFIGVETAVNDASVVVKLSQIKQANILHCEFYGLSSYALGGAILSVDHSDLNLQQSAFLGCSTNSTIVTSIVNVTAWVGVLVRDCKFIDYGQSDFYGKTPWAPPFSWIGLGDALPLEPAWSRREAVIDNLFLDEGAWFQISSITDLYTSELRPYDIYLTRINMNVNNLFSDGIYIRPAQRVFIDRSRFGWSQRAGYAINLVGAGNAILDLIETAVDATRLRATGDRLAVINSSFSSIDSLGLVPNVFSTATPEEDPAQYVRQQYLAVLNQDPDPAGHFYWTDKILLCGTDQACANQTKGLLGAFLTAAPPAKVSISGTVVDENGVALEGANVNLTGSESVAMASDQHGNFAFQRVAAAGEYVLTPAKNHYSFSSTTMVTPTGDQTRILTGTLLRHTISGHVSSSTGQDLAGVTVTLSGSDDETTTTDNKGNFSFPNLPGGGDYAVSVARANYNFPDSVREFDDLSGDQVCSFTGTLRSYTISGVVSTAKSGVSVGLEGARISVIGSVTTSTMTDIRGVYSLVLPGEGDYKVSVARANYDFSVSERDFNDLSGNQVCSFAGTLRSYTISGVVSTVKSGVSVGLEGARISVTGSVTTSTMTDDRGVYSLILPGEGDYTIGPSKANYQFTPRNLVLSDLSNNQAIDFSASPIPVLLASSDPTRLLALDAVLRTVEPFDLSYDHEWSDDPRTRIVMFATNFEMEPNDTVSDFVVELEDASHRIYVLTVESAAPIRLDDSIVCFVVRLSDDLSDVGDVKLRLAYKGTYSDPLLIAIGHLGSGTSN